jgi:hypothetical protein
VHVSVTASCRLAISNIFKVNMIVKVRANLAECLECVDREIAALD